MNPAGLRPHLSALLACPHCTYGIEVREDVARCSRCGYCRGQTVPGCVDLRPWTEPDSGWHSRQTLMEEWYRDLAHDPLSAIRSFDYDFSDLEPLLGQLRGSIIDIGGGLGIARQYVPSECSYVIVEPSVHWLDPVWRVLDDQFPSLRDEVDLIIGVGESLPVRSGSFDAALMLWSLNHTSDPARTIHEAYRVLRQPGRLILVLEDVSPTEADLDGRPDLAGVISGQVQPDHIAISESAIEEHIAGRFRVNSRCWMKHYLLLDLARTQEGVVQPQPGYPVPSCPGDDEDAQVAWWKAWFESGGLSWPSDFEARLRPDAPLQSHLAARLHGSGAVSILDVGSGPVSRVGRTHPSVQVRVTSVDPLADRYRALLASFKCDPSLAPLRGSAESLDRLFPPGTFDLVNMENALDRCGDPIEAINQMLKVAKPGVTVLLLHEENEGDATGYADGCRWNITERAGHLLMWNRDETIDLTALLAARAEVVTRRLEVPGYRAALEVALRSVPAGSGISAPAEAITAPVPSRRTNLASLAWTLVRTDFKIRYHGSLGGFGWALLRPLSLFFVLQTVFSLIFTMDRQYRLNLIVGLFLWEFFTEATRSGLGSLAAKAHLLTKVRVPAWLLVVCSSANALVMLAIFVVIILTSLAVSGASPPPVRLALFFAYLIQFYAIVIGFGLATSVLFLRFRDANELWDLTTQVGFFAAPIIYPLAILPERLHLYLYAWPPTPVIQFARAVLVAGEVPSLRAHLLLLAASATALLVGGLIFAKHRGKAVEYL